METAAGDGQVTLIDWQRLVREVELEKYQLVAI
jgi:hypothetical protein